VTLRIMNQARPAGYRGIQIALHWLVAMFVLVQYLTSEAIVRTHTIHRLGQRQDPTDLMLHTVHIRLGLALVALMIVRLALRLWFGAPAPIEGTEGWSVSIARLVHAAFYAVLITEGVTGAIASYFWWPMSVVHVILFKVLLGLVSIHVAAAIWHTVILKDATLARMMTTRFLGRGEQG
jgi:cytochrome b561